MPVRMVLRTEDVDHSTLEEPKYSAPRVDIVNSHPYRKHIALENLARRVMQTRVDTPGARWKRRDQYLLVISSCACGQRGAAAAAVCSATSLSKMIDAPSITLSPPLSSAMKGYLIVLMDGLSRPTKVRVETRSSLLPRCGQGTMVPSGTIRRASAPP
jgi:hypothetical protein